MQFGPPQLLMDDGRKCHGQKRSIFRPADSGLCHRTVLASTSAVTAAAAAAARTRLRTACSLRRMGLSIVADAIHSAATPREQSRPQTARLKLVAKARQKIIYNIFPPTCSRGCTAGSRPGCRFELATLCLGSRAHADLPFMRFAAGDVAAMQAQEGILQPS